MSNQRGITVSSSISTIAEEIVSHRINKEVEFTQAQAGGRKDGSTADHVFILKNIISLTKKEKRNVILTFYDVVKAYDRADMDDMCHAMSQNGIKGKLWRLMKCMNEQLTAKVNTKAGLTREIVRETGGKQGGKLMVTMFAGMMDRLTRDMEENEELGIKVCEERIPCLLYVDDVFTIAEGYKQQEQTLNEVFEFSLKHKLKWGPEKCKTMEVGSHKEKRDTWKLGDDKITKCENYKYLGEIIDRNGKNTENIKQRCAKLRSSVRAILTCCKSEVMRKVGMSVLIKLHSAETLSAFLYNAETWTLNKSEKKILDQANIYAWKKMIGLPQTTPTAGILLTIGSLFTSVQVEQKQLLYLHKVLKKDNKNWAKTTLLALREYNIGWARQINELLETWEIETNWETIEQKTRMDWKREVTRAAEKRNVLKLREECETTRRGETMIKTKTSFVLKTIDTIDYQRKHDTFIDSHNGIQYTRALIMARYGMLRCANNFHNGFGTKLCDLCNVCDDENHRINTCKKWREINLYDNRQKIEFNDIYSNDIDKCFHTVQIILAMWDLENGKNEMR